jgi:dTDP-4-dehydrorhamnose 3,5-epimerase
MIFHETKLAGAFVVELDRKVDHRGFFSRACCTNELKQHGIVFQPVQANISHSNTKGTLRGMHYQGAPVSETKFIRCIRGSVWDVIIDMRPGSPTFMQHFGVELSAENGRAVYVPDLFAHGNQALEDDSEMFYLMGGAYTPGFERGVRFDDPVIGIEWPLAVSEIDAKDRNWPLLEPSAEPPNPLESHG